MKKILIGILTILFIVLVVFTLVKGISIGSFEISSIKGIKEKSNNLDELVNTANELTKKTYPTKLEEINSLIRRLAIAKEKYEAKTQNVEEGTSLGVVQVKSYKVEFLWVIIENYAKKEGLVLKMDVEDTNGTNNNSEKIYNLNFSITGDYIGITNFIYDIENDEELEFKIKNLVINPQGAASTTVSSTTNTVSNTTNTTTNTVSNTTNTTTNTKTNTAKTNTTTNSGKNLQATFEVENIGIEF